jgi:ribosome-associated protein
MTTSPVKTSAALEKKDVQKLQRAIIDGLEDVKAQDIMVFDTEHITSLFERVIIASGTSNRQTKALAASVRDAVRDAGFSKPRIEGEDNGEWIIVDCGAAVAHIMQPTIRQYYHLEELWGDKPIKLKLGAPAPLVKAAKVEPAPAPEPVVKAKAKPGRKTAGKPLPKTLPKPLPRRLSVFQRPRLIPAMSAGSVKPTTGQPNAMRLRRRLSRLSKPANLQSKRRSSKCLLQKKQPLKRLLLKLLPKLLPKKQPPRKRLPAANETDDSRCRPKGA